MNFNLTKSQLDMMKDKKALLFGDKEHGYYMIIRGESLTDMLKNLWTSLEHFKPE